MAFLFFSRRAVPRVCRGLGVLFLLAAATAQAQAPAGGGPEPGAQPATSVPIDGGASALLAAGAAYGLRRLRRRRAQR